MLKFQIVALSMAITALGACSADQDTSSANSSPKTDGPPSLTDASAPIEVAASAAQSSPAQTKEAPARPPKAFRQCAVCHAVAPDARKKIGPNLYGTYGKPAAQADFAYSKALREANLVWDDATLDAFLENPQKVVRGNRMAFAGERDPDRRRILIDYLATLKDE